MDDILLEAKNICYTYEGENTPALNQLSLQIPKGKKKKLCFWKYII